MLEWVISSAVLTALIIALHYIFKGKISLRLQYALWALVLVRLLVPVSFGSTGMSVMNTMPDTDYDQGVVTIRLGGIAVINDGEQRTEYELPSQQTEYNSERESLEGEGASVGGHFHQIRLPVTELRLFWLSGVALMALWLLISNLRFATRLHRSRRVLHVEGYALLVYISPEVDTPCLFGLLRPSIYLTPEAADNETVLRHSIEHETTHFRHGDHIWAILRGLCLTIHWYNPLVWWAAVLSRNDAELACDEATIRRIGENERAEYGRTLIEMTCQKRPALLLTATTMTGSKKGIKERIALIAKKPKMAIYTLIAVILIAAVAVGCTFTGAKDSEETGPWLWAQAVVPEQIVVENDGIDTKSLAMILNELDEEDFSRNTTFTGGIDVLLVAYAEQQYFLIIGKNSDVVTLEFEGAFWDIASPELYEFIAALWPTNGAVGVFESRDAIGYDDVYISISPTKAVAAGDDYTYIVPVDQETWREAWDEALASAQELSADEISGQMGIWVIYQDEWCQLMSDGSIMADGKIAAADAAELYTLAMSAAREAGYSEVVRPADISGVVSATLDWNGVQTITEPDDLARIETWLSESTELYGGAACWFTGLLTLEQASGESVTVNMATDSCGIWMSEGVCYQYASGNEEFYAIFSAKPIHDASTEGIEAVSSLLWSMDWSRYYNSYGADETFALMDMLCDWATEVGLSESDRISRYMSIMYCTRGLDGAYADYYCTVLGDMYETDKLQFAWSCLGNLTDEAENEVVHLLAYDLGVSVEETRALLEAELD